MCDLIKKSMKNKMDSNFAIAILALVAACVGFSFWFLRVSDDFRDDNMLQTLYKVEDEIMQGNDVKDEKYRYTNRIDKYSIEYPSDWQFEESEGSVIFSPQKHLWDENGFYGSVILREEDRDLKQYVQEYSLGQDVSAIKSNEQYKDGQTLGYKLVTSTDIGINNVIYFFENNGKYYTMTHQENSRNLDQIELIVNSLNLPDGTSMDVSSWKTYTNESCGYEMKIPQRWRVYVDLDCNLHPNEVPEGRDGTYLQTSLVYEFEEEGPYGYSIGIYPFQGKELGIVEMENWIDTYPKENLVIPLQDGIELYQYIDSSRDEDMSRDYVLSKSGSNRIFIVDALQWDILGSKDNPEYQVRKEIFDKMLGTFKFLDE